MPWLSNMLLNGLFVAQQGTPATEVTPAAATPADVGTPASVATPGELATPAAPGTPASLATPGAPGTPGGDTATPVVVITPGADGTPAVVLTPSDNGTPGIANQGLPPVQYQQFQNGLGGGQWFTLILFSLMCIGLITCVLFQNSKSDGLGGMMGGGSASLSTFKGKKSSEERLNQVTTWFATAFIVTSLGMAIMFK